jgi:hypothetical protein
VRFGPADYREAANERLQEANLALQVRSLVGAHLNSGLAVECMLRAFFTRIHPEFEHRHDLVLLSGPFLRHMSNARREEVRNAIAEISVLWLNNHRYCSSRKLRSHFNRIGRYGKETDMLYANGSRMIELATTVVQYGEARWNT